MKAGKLSNFLSTVGYTANKWIRPYEINHFILEHDGNQFYNPLMEKVYFDTNNELIKIKFSKLIPVSGRLDLFQYNPNDKTLHFQKYGTVYVNKSINEPAIGDVVYCYDPVGNSYTKSEISNTVTNSYGKTMVTMSDNKVISKIQSATNGLRFFILQKGYTLDAIHLADPCQFYKEQDVDEFDADTYIGTDRLVGFEFSKEWGG